MPVNIPLSCERLHLKFESGILACILVLNRQVSAGPIVQSSTDLDMVNTVSGYHGMAGKLPSTHPTLRKEFKVSRPKNGTFFL